MYVTPSAARQVPPGPGLGSAPFVTLPTDFYRNRPMHFPWRLQMEFHSCNFWCVIFCPGNFTLGISGASGTRPSASRGGLGRRPGACYIL